MKGPEALLSLYETMTIYKGPVYTYCIFLFHGYYIRNFIYLYRNTDVFTHRSYILVPLRIYFTQELESLQSDHLNSSYGIFMPTSRFTDFTEGQIEVFIFQWLVSIFNTGSLYSFKAKMLRVLFQLESPNSECRNSRYVRNNSDYSMIN